MVLRNVEGRPHKTLSLKPGLLGSFLEILVVLLIPCFSERILYPGLTETWNFLLNFCWWREGCRGSNMIAIVGNTHGRFVVSI